jgi:hypothetical protein
MSFLMQWPIIKDLAATILAKRALAATYGPVDIKS